MIFNSFEFASFFVLVFVLYWFVFSKSVKLQNIFLLGCSYFFYAWWDWRFLSILVASSALNFFLGIYLEKSTDARRRNLLLWTGIVQGLGGLVFFKYYNFFVQSFADAFSVFGVTLSLSTLHIILPLGISFYTFKTISYLLDIDKGKIKPTQDWVVFFNYVAFFPAIMSGPIDRAKGLIPQLEKDRTFNYETAVDGMIQILWGMFKKMVIADNCAAFTNFTFENADTLPASNLVLAALFYTIQLYADFSGYSDMAIGFSKLLGFSITKNFEYPLFAQNIAQFWQKWHMSLTSWLTEYVFTPLTIAFRNYGNAGLILAILINFTVIGIWHGANWTFVLFGFLHGCYYIPLILRGTMMKKKKIEKGKLLPSFQEAVNITGVFLLVSFTFIIFRADSISDAFRFISNIFSGSLLQAPESLSKNMILMTVLFMLIEWNGRDHQFPICYERLKFFSKPLRWGIYYSLLLIIFYFGGSNQQFIYFQF